MRYATSRILAAAHVPRGGSLIPTHPGGKAQEFLFSLFYSLFAFVTMLPAYLWFEYEWVNFAFVCFVIALAVWNGANFYVRSCCVSA